MVDILRAGAFPGLSSLEGFIEAAHKNITGYQRDLLKMRADHATSLLPNPIVVLDQPEHSKHELSQLFFPRFVGYNPTPRIALSVGSFVRS